MKKVLCCFFGLLALSLVGCNAQIDSAQKSKCEANDAKSCYEIGMAILSQSQLRREDGGKMFDANALKLSGQYLLKACNLNYGEGCFFYGMTIVVSGLNKLDATELDNEKLIQTKLKKAFQDAVKYNQKACDLGSVAGCDDLARAYLSGAGVKKDRKKAFVLSQKSCNLAQSNKEDVDIFDAGTARAGASCSRVGRMYYKGDAGVKQNKQLALRYFYKACEVNGMECGMLVGGFVEQKDYKFAFDIAKKGCDLGNDLSCNHLGILYTQGQGIKQNSQKSFSTFYKLCNQNKTSYTIGVKQMGCYNLALCYASGRGVEKSYKKAFDIFKTLCDEEDEMGGACEMVGEFYLDAKGVRQDYGKALEYFGKACDLGEQNGCDNHKMLKQKHFANGL